MDWFYHYAMIDCKYKHDNHLLAAVELCELVRSFTQVYHMMTKNIETLESLLGCSNSNMG